MSEPQYDIFFRGEALDGSDINHTKAHFSKLFKAEGAKLEQLFSGKVIALKKNLNKVDAAKYQQLFKNAGAKIYIKAAVIDTAAAAPTPVQPTTDSEAAKKPAASTSNLEVMPAGSDVLNSQERKADVQSNIDTSKITLSPESALPPIKVQPAVNIPDISHLSAADVGSDLLIDKPITAAPPSPNTEHISVADLGCDMQDYYDDIPSFPPDTDHISLAEVGENILAAKAPSTAKAPDVSHIQLSDNR
jgi:hypothetical protein